MNSVIQAWQHITAIRDIVYRAEVDINIHQNHHFIHALKCLFYRLQFGSIDFGVKPFFVAFQHHPHLRVDWPEDSTEFFALLLGRIMEHQPETVHQFNAGLECSVFEYPFIISEMMRVSLYDRCIKLSVHASDVTAQYSEENSESS